MISFVASFEQCREKCSEFACSLFVCRQAAYAVSLRLHPLRLIPIRPGGTATSKQSYSLDPFSSSIRLPGAANAAATKAMINQTDATF